MYSLEQIRYFIEVVKSGSLNKAAEKLYISQPSLSKQIRLLEKNIGCELLYRNYDGITPTEKGKYFYEEMLRITEEMDFVIRSTKEIAEEDKKVYIGGLSNLLTYVLPLYEELLKPDKTYQIHTDACLSNEELIAGVRNGIYDLALLSNATEQKDLFWCPILREPLFVIYPKGHTLKDEREIDFGKLVSEEKLILYKEPCTIRKSILKKCKELSIKPNIYMELDLTESILLYVIRGEGISLLPASVAIGLQSPLVDMKEINKNEIEREVVLITKKENMDYYKNIFKTNK